MNNIKERKDVILDESEYNDIHVKGSISILKNIIADCINLKGDLTGDYSIKCKNEIDIKGSIICKSIEAEKFSLHGKVQINSISCKDLKIVSSRKSKIENIKADTVQIVNGSSAEMNKKIMDKLLNKIGVDNLDYSPNNEDCNFVISSIEGKTIKLENVQVDTIKCENITLVGKCNVKELIYSGTISIDKNSTVSVKKRI